ncbi:hypothetical protein HPP92_010187 [Vanilla planifolia]|uniref:CCT domain-containing protein n=1 Tax=Vanilla planifolia TaxID=51239 RepID=A0A835R936_VANPL|nr:hypothetical protein HPP92_010187 [Vanilla planifolia]
MPSSPTFLMSSCLTGGSGGTYRFDLEILAKASSPSPRSINSSPSSTVSESSNSTPVSISTKRARAPRKRPNQCSAEAAALLSTIFPKIFTPGNVHRTTFMHQPVDDPFPVLLSSFPITDEATLLLRELPTPGQSSFRMESKPTKLQPTTAWSPSDIQFQEPGSPDFDAESILDEEVEEGIDSIMGNLSMSPNQSKENNCNHHISNTDYLTNPHLASVMAFGLGGAFAISSNIRRALKQSDLEWWKSPPVAVEDIVPSPKIKASLVKGQSSEKKKKKKKKVEKEEAKEKKVDTSNSSPEGGTFKAPLSLKLNYDDILKNWSGGSPFSGEDGSPESAADVIAKLSKIDLLTDSGGAEEREASLQRYKEKRRNRLFSKKIRYEVRKVNADQRPRVKGRFVRVSSLLQEASLDERR